MALGVGELVTLAEGPAVVVPPTGGLDVCAPPVAAQPARHRLDSRVVTVFTTADCAGCSVLAQGPSVKSCNYSSARLQIRVFARTVRLPLRSYGKIHNPVRRMAKLTDCTGSDAARRRWATNLDRTGL